MRYEKRTTLVCLTLLYGPVTEAGDGNKVAVLGPEEKNNMCEIIINNLLLLVISIKKVLNYCSLLENKP